MTKHLYEMLGTELRPQGVRIDDYGWNLVYEDSSAGLERLTRCFERYNNESLFSQYELRMQCYPNGKQPRPQEDADIHKSGMPDDSSAFDNSVAPRVAGFNGRRLNYLELFGSLGSKVDNVSLRRVKADNVAKIPSHALPDNLFSHLSDTTRTHEVPSTGTSTTLLSFRSDRDETVSLGSSVTRSNGSRIKRDRCFRCRGESVPGSSILARCSTCPRQYHRRCHLDFAIPADLPETHNWTCASCVKKVMADKQISKEDVPKSPSKHKVPVHTTETGPKDAPGKQQTSRNNDKYPVAMDVDDTSNTQLQLLQSDSKSPQNDTQSQGDLKTKPKSTFSDEHAPLFDADDLVAKSFAAVEVQPHSNPPTQIPGELKITRTKVPLKPPRATAQQSQGEEQPDQNGSSATDGSGATPSNTGIKDTNMSEVIIRNSVADLRALAHQRHQAAITNGAEGHFASEEQRSRHNSSENTPRPSPVPQLPSGTGVPQKPSTTKSGIAAPAVAKQAIEREIPESPDEVRRGESSGKDPIINCRVLAPLQPTEITFSPPSRRTTTQDGKSPTPMRPRAPSAVVKCQNCEKMIPKGPTGKNKLCSGCKRDAAAAAGSDVPVDTKAAPQSSIAPLQTSFAPVENMGASPQTLVAPAELDLRSEEAIKKNPQERGPPVSNGGIRGVACDTCRKRHKKCTHNDLVAQPMALNTLNEQGEDLARSNTPPQGANAGLVDDISLAQEAKPTAPDQGLIYNPLAAKILGELQFAPTMQIQLREEPSMAESKIFLLKQILEENDDAKTDGLLLATELAEAQRLSFIKSVVGDSSNRSKGSRLILVAMALGSTASRRMQAKDVMNWIDGTIPGYRKGEGNWVSRISAMLSQGRRTSSGSGHGGYSGYWREDEWQEGDGGKPKAKWYQLLPEKQEEMWTWCPVLKQPLSPSARREALTSGKTAVLSVPATARAFSSASTSAPVAPNSSTNEAVSIYCGSFVQGEDGKRLGTAGPETTEDVSIKINGLMAEEPPQSVRGVKRKHHSLFDMANLSTPERKDSASSEDESLPARAKRKRSGMLPQDRSNAAAANRPTPPNGDSEDHMDLDPVASVSDDAKRGNRVDNGHGNMSKTPGTLVDRTTSGLLTLYLNGARRTSAPGTLNHFAPAKREQLATSLYKEWPEFCQHASDEYDKLAEIQMRPKKKKLFGKLGPHTQTQFGKDPVAQPVIPFNFLPEKRSRTRMVDPRPDEPYPWENSDNDPTLKEYTFLEQLFDFPNNMIPIVSEGQLAYRDGTRTDDGRLPRAREIFKL